MYDEKKDVLLLKNNNLTFETQTYYIYIYIYYIFNSQQNYHY